MLDSEMINYYLKLFTVEKKLIKRQLRIYGYFRKIKSNFFSDCFLDDEYYYFLKELFVTNYDIIDNLLKDLNDREFLIIKTVYIDLNNKKQIECKLNINKRKAYYEADKILKKLAISSLDMVSIYELF